MDTIEVVIVEIAKLNLGADDILVVRLPSGWNHREVAARLRESVGEHIRALLIEMPAEISVIHPDANGTYEFET